MRIKAAIIAGAMALTTTAAISAQGPIIGAGNLVNVQVGTIDVLTGNTVIVRDINVNVRAAVQIAANVCGVAVGVLADDVADDGQAYCETGDQIARDFVRITQ